MLVVTSIPQHSGSFADFHRPEPRFASSSRAYPFASDVDQGYGYYLPNHPWARHHYDPQLSYHHIAEQRHREQLQAALLAQEELAHQRQRQREREAEAILALHQRYEARRRQVEQARRQHEALVRQQREKESAVQLMVMLLSAVALQEAEKQRESPVTKPSAPTPPQKVCPRPSLSYATPRDKTYGNAFTKHSCFRTPLHPISEERASAAPAAPAAAPSTPLKRKPALRRPTQPSTSIPIEPKEQEKSSEPVAVTVVDPSISRKSSLSSLGLIRAEFDLLKFTQPNPTAGAKEARHYPEQLVNFLERADAVESDGDESVRSIRRSLAKDLQAELDRFETAVNEKKSVAFADPVVEDGKPVEGGYDAAPDVVAPVYDEPPVIASNDIEQDTVEPTKSTEELSSTIKMELEQISAPEGTTAVEEERGEVDVTTAEETVMGTANVESSYPPAQAASEGDIAALNTLANVPTSTVEVQYPSTASAADINNEDDMDEEIRSVSSESSLNTDAPEPETLPLIPPSLKPETEGSDSGSSIGDDTVLLTSDGEEDTGKFELI